MITGSAGTAFGLTTDALVFPVPAEASDVQQSVRDIVDTRAGAVFHIDLDNGSPPQPASATTAYPEDATVDTEALSPVGSAAGNRELA